MPFNNVAYASERREERHEVHYRTRVLSGDGRDIAVVVVNISPNGLMARCDELPEPGTRVYVRLPGIGPLHAEVRWSLGGRIGCEFQQSIPAAGYYALLRNLT